MNIKYFDFSDQISTMRVNLDNEARALLRNASLNRISFDDTTYLSISDEDEDGLWNVKSIYVDKNELLIETQSHNDDTTYMDCSTDDMIAVYNAIYYHISNLK